MSIMMMNSNAIELLISHMQMWLIELDIAFICIGRISVNGTFALQIIVMLRFNCDFLKFNEFGKWVGNMVEGDWLIFGNEFVHFLRKLIKLFICLEN